MLRGLGYLRNRRRMHGGVGMLLAVEWLEDRRLLAVNPSLLSSAISSSQIAHPTYEIFPVGAASSFSTATPTGYTPTQIRHAYGFDQITFSNGTIVGDGTGQTIAIIDAYDTPTIAHDLAAFDSQFGIPAPPTFTRVAQDGTTNYPVTDPVGPGNNNWEGETALDVEWSHTLAPGASILLVEATTSSSSDLLTAVNFARNQPGVAVVSMSFGGDEDTTDPLDNATYTTPAGHAGVTFVASTGDDGSPGGYPSFSPNVLAVGGTTLTLNAANNISSETGWIGSGGGISQFEPQPPYQIGFVTQSLTKRTIPDVAFDADPATGVPIYDSYNGSTTDPWEQIGGTSFSAPSWAALIAIADQGRPLVGLTSLDGPNATLPAIYSLPASDFNDITSGSNGGFSAGPGYDLVTGRGSPKANLVVAGLTQPVLPRVSIINDASALEGDSGFTNEVFTVSVSGFVTKPTIVAFSTVDGTATASPGDDYVAQSGTLTFQPGGPTTMLITVQVVGDTVVEPDETYFVQLSSVANEVLGRAQAVGTILNDDIDVSINDITATQLKSGTTNAVFTISANGTVPFDVPIVWSTANNTANAGVDYLPASGIITFAAGSGGGTANVTVPILGQPLYHSPETFFVDLSTSSSAHLVKPVGVATVVNVNPPPEFYVNDVHVTAAQAGQASAVFTVGLDSPSGDVTFVQYATADGTAQAGVNYSAESNTLTFAPGVTSMLVTVPVVTNSVYTPDEQFFLNLFNPVHAEITDPQGMATIIFGTPPPAESIVDDGDAAYGETNGWTNFTNTLAYQLDAEQHPAGDGSGFADWDFTGLPAGNYQVFAKWIPFSDRATNAPYTIYDGATPLATVRVNQQVMPSGDQSNGVVWQSLGTFNEFTGKLTVRLNDNANGTVVADAIRVVSGGIGPQAPQMDVSGSGQSIADSTAGPAAAALFSNGTDFGGVAAFSSSFINTFTITNTGNADLLLTGAPRVSISGANASDFTVVSQPPSTIAAGASATFQVMFHPGAVGERTAVLSIPDNDPTQAPYTFNIAGTGTAAGPSQLIVDDSGGGFQAAGGWATNANTLAYQGELRSDAAGQGADHATWTFSDLAPGNYTVYTTWVPFQNRATNAPFTIMDGATSRGTVLVNEQQTPGDVSYGGVMWKTLSTLSVTSGTLSVNLNNQANGYVIADAVYLVHNDVPSAVATTTNSGTAGAGTTPSSGNTSSTGTTSSTTNSVGGSSLLGGTTIHNAADPLDVNGDGVVSALDALILIDHLLAPTPDTSTAYFMDVNGDGAISPADLLAVIDFLHTAGPQSAVATSQAAAAADAAIGQLVATPAAATVAVSSAATVSSSTSSSAATNGALMQAAAVTVAKKSTSSTDSGSQVNPLAG